MGERIHYRWAMHHLRLKPIMVQAKMEDPTGKYWVDIGTARSVVHILRMQARELLIRLVEKEDGLKLGAEQAQTLCEILGDEVERSLHGDVGAYMTKGVYEHSSAIFMSKDERAEAAAREHAKRAAGKTGDFSNLKGSGSSWFSERAEEPRVLYVDKDGLPVHDSLNSLSWETLQKYIDYLRTRVDALARGLDEALFIQSNARSLWSKRQNQKKTWGEIKEMMKKVPA